MIKWDDYWKNYSISKAERWMVETRHNFITSYIDKIDKNTKQIMEVGCGFGSNLKLIRDDRNDVECHALDNSTVAIDKLKEEFPNSYLADCMDTKLPEKKFDIIYSAGLMEHFRDENPFIMEMGRVLDDEGYIITIVPARISLWQLYQLLHFGNWQHGYEKSYTHNQLVNLFIKHNFTVVDVFGVDPFSLNGFIMKLFNKRFEPKFLKSPLKSGYTELAIVVKKNK